MSSHPQYPPQQPYQQPGNPFSDQMPNPYAAPQQAGYYQQPAMPQKLPAFAGLWRQGNVLVMHKMAPLPDICLLSNQPANRRLTRNLSWHHPAIALTILAGLLIYVILAVILTKRATILLPLTNEWYARRQRRMLYSWGVGLACLGMMVGGVILTAQTDHGEFLLLTLVGFIGGLVTLIAGQALVGLVSPKRITDEYVWLKGVHPDFLNRLDPWPYNI